MNVRTHPRRSKGFTMVELSIVMLIIGLMVTFLLVASRSYDVAVNPGCLAPPVDGGVTQLSRPADVLAELAKEVRDRFGPVPPTAELLFLLGDLKLLAAERGITSLEVEEDKLKLKRRGDFIQVGGKFPRLTKKTPEAKLKEIRRLLSAV